MSILDANSLDDASTENDDSAFDVDLIEVDNLLSSASRLLEEVYSNRPQIEETIDLDNTMNSPRDDAIEQVQRFLNSIRETEEEDVIFVEARPGNAPPAGARTTAVVDLCTPGDDQPETRSMRKRRQTTNLQPVAFPELSPNMTSTGSRRSRRQAVKTETDASDIPPKTKVRAVTPPPSNSRKPDTSNAQSSPLPALTCAVCMESVVGRQPTSTACGHIFCQGCIMQAIRVTSKCPLCNTKLSRNKVHRVYF